MPIYAVTTKEFGDLQVEAKNIAEARAWARNVWKVKNPSLVRRKYVYRKCEVCECSPCMCEEV